MIIEDIASQSSVVFGIQHDWRDPISGVHVSPGSAETLVRRGGITNYHSLAYSLCNVSAKNYENQLMCAEVIVCYVSFLLTHSVLTSLAASRALSVNQHQRSGIRLSACLSVCPIVSNVNAATWRRAFYRCCVSAASCTGKCPCCAVLVSSVLDDWGTKTRQVLSVTVSGTRPA